MTVTANDPDIGQTRMMTVDISANTSIDVEVKIVDRRKMFDRHEFLIEPTNGDGQAWVTSKRFA
jgi:hypothetical protein